MGSCISRTSCASRWPDSRTTCAPCFAGQFVPETLRVDVVLAAFKLRHQHMAIVIDEHGGQWAW